MTNGKSSGKTNGKSSSNRTRNWSFIIYPDSAPENWREIIGNEHTPWVESPLHDKDLSGDGTPKKPHFHIIIMYDGVKTFEQVKELTSKLNAPQPQKVANTKGLVRYMAHMDDPNKVQYDKNLIIGHCGANVVELLKSTNSTRYQMIAEMRKWIADNNCTEFFVLFDYATEERMDDWFPLLCDNSAYILGEYIKSRRHSNHNKMTTTINNVNLETGEITI